MSKMDLGGMVFVPQDRLDAADPRAGRIAVSRAIWESGATGTLCNPR